MKRPFIAGNWKMHKTIREAVDFAQHLITACDQTIERRVVIAPPYTALSAVAEVLRGSSIHLSAQNLHNEPARRVYGERYLPKMLVDAGCEYAIVGHSRAPRPLW